MRVRLPSGEALPPDVERAVDEMRDQMLIVLIRRLLKSHTGSLTVPTAEIDATGDAMLSMEANGIRSFTFTLSKKS
jgi:hypothetical protein